MREALAVIDGVRASFSATFVRYGSKPAYKGPAVKTLLFSNVKGTAGSEVCDHIWFTTNKQFEKLDLQSGDVVLFDARSKPYVKGYKGYRDDDWDVKPIETDYKLSHPTNIRKQPKQVDGNQFSLF